MTLFSGGITVYDRIVMNRKVWVISGLMIIALGFSISAAPVHADDPGKIIFKDTKPFAPVVFDYQSHKQAGKVEVRWSDGTMTVIAHLFSANREYILRGRSARDIKVFTSD